MLVFNLIFKAIMLIFKFLAWLKQKGMLPSFLVSFTGYMTVYGLWSMDGIITKILALFVGIITMFLVVVLTALRYKKDNPNKSFENFGWIKYLDTTRNSHHIKSIQSPTPYGFLFGRQGKNYVTKPENLDGHVLLVGGVGSGKTSCIAIPTLRMWRSSVFAIDIKGELYEQTKLRPRIKVFNPLYDSTFGYDPFFSLRTSANPTQEARAIAQAIVPLPPDTKEPFWIETAQNILTGAILHSYQKYSFVNTLKAIQNSNPQKILEIISQSDNEKARLCVNSYVGMADNTLSGIFSELSRNIVPLVTDDRIISALTREKNITPNDLEYVLCQV